MKNCVIFASCYLLAATAWGGTFEELMADGSEDIDGKPLVEYANSWWQWTATMSKEKSPVRDKTGELCGVGQSGNVWFLAGGFGTSKIKRRCEMPSGKYVFFPVINMVYYTPEGEVDTCAEVKRRAALNNDELLSIYVEFDGVAAANPGHSRLASAKCFDLMGKVPPEQHPPKLYPSASDGYWIMLKPLAKGVHTLKFNAQYDRNKGAFAKMAQDIEYELIVK